MCEYQRIQQISHLGKTLHVTTSPKKKALSFEEAMQRTQEKYSEIIKRLKDN